jgi:hypothetical protein
VPPFPNEETAPIGRAAFEENAMISIRTTSLSLALALGFVGAPGLARADGSPSGTGGTSAPPRHERAPDSRAERRAAQRALADARAELRRAALDAEQFFARAQKELEAQERSVRRANGAVKYEFALARYRQVHGEYSAKELAVTQRVAAARAAYDLALQRTLRLSGRGLSPSAGLARR